MGHEQYERIETVEGSSNRSFGLVFAVVFAAIGFIPLFFGAKPRTWGLVLGVVFLAAAFILPGALAPLNRLWLRFGLLLHKVVSPLVLGIMFFLVVTPIGLLMRATGKDPLRLKFERQSKSYWIDRRPPGPSPESLKNQF